MATPRTVRSSRLAGPRSIASTFQVNRRSSALQCPERSYSAEEQVGRQRCPSGVALLVTHSTRDDRLLFWDGDETQLLQGPQLVNSGPILRHFASHITTDMYFRPGR